MGNKIDRNRLCPIAHYYADGILEMDGVSPMHRADIELHIEAAIEMYVTGEGEDEIRK